MARHRFKLAWFPFDGPSGVSAKPKRIRSGPDLIEAEIQLVLVLSAAVLVLVIERRRDDGHHLGS